MSESPHRQKIVRETEEAWRYGMAQAQKRANEHPTWSSACCQAEVYQDQKLGTYCKKCGRKQG